MAKENDPKNPDDKKKKSTWNEGRWWKLRIAILAAALILTMIFSGGLAAILIPIVAAIAIAIVPTILNGFKELKNRFVKAINEYMPAIKAVLAMAVALTVAILAVVFLGPLVGFIVACIALPIASAYAANQMHKMGKQSVSDSKLQEENGKLKQEIKDQNKDIKDLNNSNKNALEKVGEKVTELTGQIENLKTQLDDRDTQYTQFRQDLRKEVNELSQTHESKLGELQTQNAALQEEIANLKQQLGEPRHASPGQHDGHVTQDKKDEETTQKDSIENQHIEDPHKAKVDSDPKSPKSEQPLSKPLQSHSTDTIELGKLSKESDSHSEFAKFSKPEAANEERPKQQSSNHGNT